MRTKGIVARSNVPLPSPSGPARADFCITSGLQAIRTTLKLKGQMERILEPLIPGGWTATPSPTGLEVPGDGPFVELATRRRIALWFALRRRTRQRLYQLRAAGARELESEFAQAETLARAALHSAVEAYHWLADAKLDLGPQRGIVLDGTPQGEVGELLESAHALVHRCGDVVGGMFGCWLSYEGGIWYDECETSLMHIPFGNSMGITARHLCSICGKDFGDCEHRRGERYDVTVSRTPDRLCSVCGEQFCDHAPGTIVHAVATVRLDDIELREFTITPRPRDPLARITAREVESADLARILGRNPRPGERIQDHTCMYPCEGFRAPPEPPHAD